MSCLKNVTTPKSLEEVARPVQGQPAGKEEDSDTSGENGPLPEPKSAQVVPGRRHHCLRNLVDRRMCQDGRLVESLPERLAVISFTARRIHQTPLGTSLKCLKERVFERLLCPGSSASPWFTASCCRDGSLAVTQPIRVQESSQVPSMFEGVAVSHTCVFPTSSASTGSRRNVSTACLSQSSPYGSAHPHAVDVHASVRVPGVEKETLSHRLCCSSHVGQS